MNPLPAAIGLITLARSQFSQQFWQNLGIQLAIFIPVVQIPAYATGRMTYVDIGWPAGLVAIGAQSLVFGTGSLWRKVLVSLAYLSQGGRMLSGALTMWSAGHMNREMPRYLFQRIRWADRGIVEGTWRYILEMQKEVGMQGAMNAAVLSVPAFLQSNDSGPATMLEGCGWLLWLTSMARANIYRYVALLTFC